MGMTQNAPLSEAAVAIFGPGLLGGSLALALRAKWPQLPIRIWARRAEAASAVLSAGLADVAGTDAGEIAAGASLIILATPVETMSHLAHQIVATSLRQDALVTDVGSVKGAVSQALSPIFTGHAEFLGSHPMAGSEKAGLSEARADLFQDAACILTPQGGTSPAAFDRLRQFWQSLGCKVIVRDSATHDREVARISHLPHMMAAVTTRAALAASPTAVDCVGNGFRDSTRVAAGDPGLWTGIVAENRAEVLAALKDAHTELGQLVEIIGNLDDEALREFLTQAKALRDAVPAPTVSPSWPPSK